jgi:hypothetical protein
VEEVDEQNAWIATATAEQLYKAVSERIDARDRKSVKNYLK